MENIVQRSGQLWDHLLSLAFLGKSKNAPTAVQYEPGYRDLYRDPTSSLLAIRRKFETGTPLLKREWAFLAYYVEQGSEAFYGSPISCESFTTILKAFRSAYAYRKEVSPHVVTVRDGYYLGNLPVQDKPGLNSVDKVRHCVEASIEELNLHADAYRAPFAARNLLVLLESNPLAGDAEIHAALCPYWPTLWSVAARGHYAVHHQPIRSLLPTAADREHRAPLPVFEEDGYRLELCRENGHDLTAQLTLRWPMVSYPLLSYPLLREFRAMLDMLDPEHLPAEDWNGQYFYGSVNTAYGDPEFAFSSRENLIRLPFTKDDWQIVRTLFARAWELPEVQQALDVLKLEYGEL